MNFLCDLTEISERHRCDWWLSTVCHDKKGRNSREGWCIPVGSRDVKDGWGVLMIDETVRKIYLMRTSDAR